MGFRHVLIGQGELRLISYGIATFISVPKPLLLEETTDGNIREALLKALAMQECKTEYICKANARRMLVIYKEQIT
jgi:hypothetical protein